MISRVHLLTFLAWVATVGAQVSATTITGVDHPAVPVGETMAFTGSGFTGTSAVTLLYGPFREAAPFEVVSDSELKVTYPDRIRHLYDHYLLVESPNGSTVTMAGAVTEFSGTGSPPPGAARQIIVEAGTVLEEVPTGTRVVYLRAGAVLQNPPADASECVILAENDATLDLRGTVFSTSRPPLILHSPDTTVLGDLPAPPSFPPGQMASGELPALSLSRDIGPFTLGVRVNLSITGNGTVSRDSDGPYLRHSTDFTLTASPEPGWLFQGWSGAVSGSEPVVTTRSGTSDLDITATFTSGHVLETYSGSRGTIVRDPDLETYPGGQTVSLTASPQSGFGFVGWGGDLDGSAANPATVTMDSGKIVTAVFEPLDPPSPTVVDSVDHAAVPVGETMTFTGSGFTGASAVTLLYGPFRESAPFEVVSDSELKVTYPDWIRHLYDHYLLVESPNGSTVTMAGAVTEFSGTGSPDSFAARQLLVQPGAVLREISLGTRVVYLRSGAVLRNPPAESHDCVIFAEDGATLDLRGTTFSTSRPPLILHSPGTTVLGELPPPPSFPPGEMASGEVPALSLSRGIGPFTLGVRVNLSITGNGAVSRDPDGLYLRHSTDFTLTASPDPGWLFQGWSGALSGADSVVTGRSGTSDLDITATFTSGHVLETYPGSRGTIMRDPDLETYPSGQTVSLTASPRPGFEFVGWGGDLDGSAANPASVTIDSGTIVTAVFEPLTPPSPTLVDSVDHSVLPVGETMTLTGSGFTDASAATLIYGPFRYAAPLEVVSDSELKVTYPERIRPTNDHYLLVESPNGSTVTMAGAVTEFSGTGSPDPSAARQLLVQPGAVLQEIPDGTRVVYLRSGAVLRNPPAEAFDCVIFAEDGATLDLRGTTFSTSGPPLILHSSGATVLGDLPPPPSFPSGQMASGEISPLALSLDIGPFRVGCALDLTVEGPGTASVDPVMDFYPVGTTIQLTATPEPGNFFVRWVGDFSSTGADGSFVIRRSSTLTARFSDRPDFFTGWRTRFFTPEELADPAVSGLGADPDGDQITNAGEYAFGTDPTVSNSRSGLRILPGSRPLRDGIVRLEYIRPTFAADIVYILQAREAGGSWIEGTEGDIPFEVSEENVTPASNDLEKVTLRAAFTGEVPSALLFQLTADITDLP